MSLHHFLRAAAGAGPEGAGDCVVTAGEVVYAPGAYWTAGYISDAVATASGGSSFGDITTQILNGVTIHGLIYTVYTTFSIEQTNLYVSAAGGGLTSITINGTAYGLTYDNTSDGFDYYDVDGDPVIVNGSEYSIEAIS